jgi:Fic family protein
MLVRGTRADTAEAGHVRTTQVFIGAENRRISEARFVPPPPGDHLRDGLEAWQRWITEPHALHPVGQAALAHYQFESLHPLTDGNGRLGRLIAMLQLVNAKELQTPIVNLSPWLNARRDEYQSHLFEVSATGNFDPWVTFFCEALTAQDAPPADRRAVRADLQLRRSPIAARQSRVAGHKRAAVFPGTEALGETAAQGAEARGFEPRMGGKPKPH